MKTFEEFDLIAPVQRALEDAQYKTPTPIQAKTIPNALEGRDVLGCAQTGTGKTAAFALPILNQLGHPNRKSVPNHPFALVLAPTRELAIQIHQSFATYGKHLRLRQVVVYGGVSQLHQVRSLDRGAHILVATPGRLLDLMNQGYVKLNQLEVFVLDEADRMLDMGFLPDLKKIIKQLPSQRQSLFFSATVPSKISELSNRLLTNAVSVNVTPKSTSVEKIDQRVLFVERNAKQALLSTVLSTSDVDQALVFTRTKHGANRVAEKLARGGFSSTAIHANKTQNARQKALDAFRSKQVRVLVATDVAARGIDIDGITHVINFDIPDDPESYVHRIGRTGRAGAAGIALSFCSDCERSKLRAIEKLIGKPVPHAERQSSTKRQSEAPAKGTSGRPQRVAAKTPASGRRSLPSSSRSSNGAATDIGKSKRRRRRRKERSPR